MNSCSWDTMSYNSLTSSSSCGLCALSVSGIVMFGQILFSFGVRMQSQCLPPSFWKIPEAHLKSRGSMLQYEDNAEITITLFRAQLRW